MSNMSYCRFRNVLADLGEAEPHLSDSMRDKDEDGIKARERLIRMCHRIASEYPLEDLE